MISSGVKLDVETERKDNKCKNDMLVLRCGCNFNDRDSWILVLMFFGQQKSSFLFVEKDNRNLNVGYGFANRISPSIRKVEQEVAGGSNKRN